MPLVYTIKLKNFDIFPTSFDRLQLHFNKFQKTGLFRIPGQDRDIPTSGWDGIGIEKNYNTRDRAESGLENMTWDWAGSGLKTHPV
jgi:hypothetical protein